jgi:hypothetical protein
VPNPDDPPALRRGIDDIPPEEIDLAIDHLRAADPRLDKTNLTTLTTRVLGFDRTGGRIREVVMARIAAIMTQDGGAAGD